MWKWTETEHLLADNHFTALDLYLFSFRELVFVFSRFVFRFVDLMSSDRHFRGKRGKDAFVLPGIIL